MSSFVTVAQGLVKIFELRDAIRHQRRVNRQTYLQLTEIHLELQLLERNGPLEDNATLRRNAVLKKFSFAVTKFAAYLVRYNKKNCVTRLFKRGDMEAERLEIIAEIEQVFRMLHLATTVTVMNTSKDTAKNAGQFLARLDHVHKDVKLTHDEVQAALRALVEQRNTEQHAKVAPIEHMPAKKQDAHLDNLSVPLLMDSIANGSPNDKEKSLLLLIRKCVRSSSRMQIYQANGIPMLSKLVRESDNFVTQLYALHCLSWFTFIYSKMPESDFEMLRGCLRVANQPELVTVMDKLQHGDEAAKEDAVILCSCIATNGNEDALRDVGVLPPLTEMLENGTPNQKLWAAETLATLASNSDENCEAIAREGTIDPLIELLRVGTDMQKQEAAYALGNLAANNDAIRVQIARRGAIHPLVKFVRAVTDAQNQWGVYALGVLSLNNDENRVAIARAGAIVPLVNLVRTGSSAQQQWAVYTLGNLAHNDENRVEMLLEGVIQPLVGLLRSGTAAQKLWSAYALGNLACGNDAADEIETAIVPLVQLVETGTDSQKQEAAYTLGNIAAHSAAGRAAIAREGGIEPLVELVRSGTSELKQWAAYALEFLAYQNDDNRLAIVQEGAVSPLVSLVLSGTETQKSRAAKTLANLAIEDDVNHKVVSSERIIDPLMQFLRTGTNSQKANAATALRKLASTSDDNLETIVHEGVIPLLQALAQTGSTHDKQAALFALERFDDRPEAGAKDEGSTRSAAVAW